MQTYKKLLAEHHVDGETGCLYRYVKSETEKFVMHTHDYYEIFLTLSDNVTHLVNGKKQCLAAGCLLFIRDFDTHSYIYDKTNEFSFGNLSISTQTLNELFNYLGDGINKEVLLKSKLPPTVTLYHNEKNKLFEKLSELNTVNFNDKSKLKLKMRTLLVEIFTKYFSDYSENDKATIPYWLESCYEKMKLRANFTAGTDRLYELAGKSREHVTRCMQKYYNTTPSEYINDLRINYAANLLISSNLSVTDICYECGFSNISWFYELFKAKYKMTPKKFGVIHSIYNK